MAAQLFKNNAHSTLNGTLSVGGTTLNVAVGHGNRFPTPSAGEYFLVTLYEKDGSGNEINYEVIKVTAITGDSLTIERDFEGLVVANGGTSGGWAFPSAPSINPSGVVYIELRYTAYAASNGLTKDANLLGISSPSDARTNLGLGSIATQNANSVAITGGTITGVTLQDSDVLLVDNTDPTKKVQFELSGLTTATTRTLTVPNTSITLAGTNVDNNFAAAQTFPASGVKVKGSSTGTTTLYSANASASNYTTTLPAANTTVPIVGQQLTISGPTAARTYTLPDASATLVSLDATQTLTNKTLALGSNTVSGTTAQFNAALTDNDFATLAGTETLTNKTLALGSNTVSGTLAQFNTAVTDADLASLSGTETLTNKTVNLTNNTLSGTTAQFNAALSDGDFATLAGSETLTNKTVNLTNNTLTGTKAEFDMALSDDNFLYVGSTTYVGKDSATGAAYIPAGTSAQQPGSPAAGYFRFNTTINQFEGYNGSAWGAVGGGATGASSNPVFYENDIVVNGNYTLGSGEQLTCTISIASPAVITQANNYVAGQPVRFTTSGALPTGLSTTSVYYVSATGLSASSFQVSATSGGASVNTSGTQSGAHTCGRVKNAMSTGPITVANGVAVTVPDGSVWTIV